MLLAAIFSRYTGVIGSVLIGLATVIGVVEVLQYTITTYRAPERSPYVVIWTPCAITLGVIVAKSMSDSLIAAVLGGFPAAAPNSSSLITYGIAALTIPNIFMLGMIPFFVRQVWIAKRSDTRPQWKAACEMSSEFGRWVGSCVIVFVTAYALVQLYPECSPQWVHKTVVYIVEHNDAYPNAICSSTKSKRVVPISDSKIAIRDSEGSGFQIRDCKRSEQRT